MATASPSSSLHDELESGRPVDDPERPERPEGAHGLEDGDVAGAEDGGREVDDGDRHDHKVQQAPRVSEVREEALGCWEQPHVTSKLVGGVRG